MKKIKFFDFVIIILLMGIISVCSKSNTHYDPVWESLAKHETPEWFEDAVLGIYFHWGVYSVPAFGCWGGRNMYQPDGGDSEAWSHIDNNKYVNTYDYVKKVYGQPGTEFGYKDFIPMFKAENWNPDEWAGLFKKAGADFAGPVAIHHDGFAMWDSKYAEYNSMDMGPHRDIVGEMLKAVRKHGMKTFASFHQYTNWFFFNSGRKLCPKGVDVNNPEYAGLYGPAHGFKGVWHEIPFSESFQKAWYNKVIEVIDKYHPDQLWFEIGFSDPDCICEKYVKSALAHYFNAAEKRGEEVVVTHKSDDLPLSVSVLDLEWERMQKAKPNIWQTDIPLGESWAYSPDAICRPINDIVDEIVDRKSKNGVSLLDVAPKADGTLPESQIEGLKELGKWMAVNKPALYASKPAPFVEGGVDVAEAGSLRFTMKENYLYAIDLEKPNCPEIIPGVKPVKGSVIRMLGSSKNLSWHIDGDNLVIEELPNPLPCNYAWSFKILYRD